MHPKKKGTLDCKGKLTKIRVDAGIGPTSVSSITFPDGSVMNTAQTVVVPKSTLDDGSPRNDTPAARSDVDRVVEVVGRDVEREVREAGRRLHLVDLSEMELERADPQPRSREAEVGSWELFEAEDIAVEAARFVDVGHRDGDVAVPGDRDRLRVCHEVDSARLPA